MTQAANPLGPSSRSFIVLTAVVCVAVFVLSLLPAGFAIFLLDTPGSGIVHEVTVWGSIALLMSMPVISLLGSFMPWRMARRGNGPGAFRWCLVTLVLIALWAVLASPLYFT